MQIYHYDRDTGKYSGSSEAEICPVSRQPFIPAWATDVEPPTPGENQEVVWKDDTWILTSTQTFLCYFNNGLSNKTVDSAYVAQTGEVVFSTTPNTEELTEAFIGYVAAVKEQAIAALEVEYEPLFSALAQAYATALMAGDSTTAASVQTDYAALKTEYQTALEKITNG